MVLLREYNMGKGSRQPCDRWVLVPCPLRLVFVEFITNGKGEQVIFTILYTETVTD
jgi:hypothetical protein